MANFGEESISSEFGENPDIDSPDLEEEEYFDEEESNLDWSDEGFEESAVPAIEMPVAPDVDDFTTQEDYDEAYETYLGEHADYESQMPGQRESAELDNETYNELDRIGLTPTAKTAAREAIAAAEDQLMKAQNAELRGDPRAAREHRMRAEYMGRAAQEEMAKDSPAQAQGKKNALKIAEQTIRNARFMDDAEYNERFPNGQGFDHDARQAIDSFNSGTEGDVLYGIREYSPLNQSLSEDPKGLSDGSQLVQIKVPEYHTAQKIVANAKASRMSVLDYCSSIGIVNFQPMQQEEREREDDGLYQGMTNAEYRKARNIKLKLPQIGGVKRGY